MNLYFDPVFPFVVYSVEFDPDGQKLVLRGDDFISKITVTLEGDCCSQSYFELGLVGEVEAALKGARLFAIREVGSGRDDHYDPDKLECSRYHAIEFLTRDGVTSLDWRNDSNGYYDGTAVFKYESQL